MADNTIGGKYRALIQAIEFTKKVYERELMEEKEQLESMNSETQIYAYVMGSIKSKEIMIDTLNRWL